ncbi:MAG: transporter [Longimicrobiales bacterium]|nr:transporter [Longimicrobiales bacterium]
MLRKSLAALAVLTVVAAPAAAQVEDTPWSSDRPDARAPSAILGSRILDAGTFEFGYRLHYMDYGDTRIGTDNLDRLEVLSLFQGAPFSRTEKAHFFTAAFGVANGLTLEASAAWMDRDREFGDEFVFVENNSSGISDIEAAALIEIFSGNRIRAHLIGGVEIPTGSTDKVGPDLVGTNRVLAYEMQLGTGSFSVVPGAVFSIQNDKATVGAQVKARFRLDDNDRGYRHGDRFDGALWAGYVLNDHFALTTGARVSKWESLEGFDPAMNPDLDPGQVSAFSAGTRVDVPLGLNIRLLEGLLAGTELDFEFQWPVHEDYDAPRQEGEWGINFGVRRALSLVGGS